MAAANSGITISVILPAYNAEQYIAKAIQSCLSQSYAPREIIVIDDASDDRTAAVAESFPSPVRVFRQEKNMGVSAARNRGVQASTGDWLAFLDADDWFLPEKLKLQWQCALENPRAVLIYGASYTFCGGVLSPVLFNPPAKLWPQLRYSSGIHVGTVMLRRDAFNAVGGYSSTLRNCENYDLWLKIAARYSVKSFAAVPQPLAVYRKTSASLSSNAMRNYRAKFSLLESRCLQGTSGLSRRLWRRRIFAFLCYDSSIALREEGSFLYLFFMVKSILAWPFPWSAMPMRFKIAAVMAKQRLFGIHSR